MKRKLIVIATCLAICILLGTSAYAMTSKVWASTSTGTITLKSSTQFNAKYLTQASDSIYKVKKGKYIRQSYSHIVEGNYDKYDWSEVCSKDATTLNKIAGTSYLSKVNNPLINATVTYGWHYQ